MRRGCLRSPKIAGGLLLLALTGCHQHHYYLNNPQLAQVDPSISTIAYGDVCNVPAGTVVAGSPVISSGTPVAGPILGQTSPVVIAGAPGSSSVLSQPRTSLLGGRLSRSWRASDPEQRVTLKAEGAYDDPIIK